MPWPKQNFGVPTCMQHSGIQSSTIPRGRPLTVTQDGVQEFKSLNTRLNMSGLRIVHPDCRPTAGTDLPRSTSSCERVPVSSWPQILFPLQPLISCANLVDFVSRFPWRTFHPISTQTNRRSFPEPRKKVVSPTFELLDDRSDRIEYCDASTSVWTLLCTSQVN
jgi:hypothetical protein